MTDRPHTSYSLSITRTAARSLAEKLPEKVATAAFEFINGPLLDNPHRVGKQLSLEPYVGTWSARRGGYRILYEIDEDRRVVEINNVEHRADAYRSR